MAWCFITPGHQQLQYSQLHFLDILIFQGFADVMHFFMDSSVIVMEYQIWLKNICVGKGNLYFLRSKVDKLSEAGVINHISCSAWF